MAHILRLAFLLHGCQFLMLLDGDATIFCCMLFILPTKYTILVNGAHQRPHRISLFYWEGRAAQQQSSPTRAARCTNSQDFSRDMDSANVEEVASV